MKALIHITITFVIFGIHNLLGSATLQNGLVGHWKFDETSGTTAHDSSGNEYDAILYGTSNGSASWVSGKVGGAIDLDGSNDYLAIKDLHYSQPGQIPAISISAWIKTNMTSEGAIISYDRSEYFRFSIGGGNAGKLFFASTDARGSPHLDDQGDQTVNDDSWRHVAITYNSSSSKKYFYIDGVLDHSVTSNHGNRNLGTGVSRFGIIGQNCEDINFNQMQSGSRGQIPFNGSLDDLRLYNRAISQSEVGMLCSLGNRYGDPDGDRLYNFEEETLGTNPLLVDTDGDGLSDSVEVQKFTTFERISRTGEFTFDEAVLDAEGRGGYLATITSSDENNDVDEIATSNEWLGATDRELEGTWKWLTGEHWTYSNWNPNEPNNSGNEDGLHFYSDGKWNDIPLTSDYAYILEKPVFTEVSDPLNSDSDGDGFMDSIEIASGSNVNNDSSLPSDLPAFFGEATLWLDGTNIDLLQNTTITDGESISQWLDQSGNSHNLFVINSARSPVLNSASVNSKDVVSFTGDSLKTNEAIAVRSILTVHKTLNSHYLWDFRNDIPNSWIWHGGVGGYWTHHVKNGITQINVSRANIMNNQLQVGYFAGNAMGSGSFYLHSRFSEAEMGSGDVCELLVFDRLLTAQELDSGEAYLAKKWGLDSIVDSDSDGFNDSVEYDAGSNPESNGSIPDLGYGLVAWYPLDGNVSDMSGNGFDGGFTDSANDPVVAPDRFDRPNRAFYFDGNDRLKLDHRALDGLSAFSLSIWAKVESFDKMPVFMSAASNAGANELFFFYTPSSGNGKIFLQENESAESHNLANTVGLSIWRNLTLARESGASLAKFYVDGSLAKTFTFSSSTAPVDVATGGLWLGADQDSVGGGWENQQHFNGWLDEIRFYNRALNASEVNTIFKVTRLISSDSTDVDDTAPIITLHGDSNVIHEAGELYVDANASWTDGVDGSGTLVATGEVNVSIPGTYTLSYNFTDAAGNAAQTVTRTVNVVDTTAPLITLNGNSNITHEAGDLYVDTNASWTDEVDGSGVLVAAGQVNVSSPGTYLLSYNFTDAAGNVAQTVTRTVNVVDTIAPVISLNGDGNITHEVGFVYVDANATWSDAVDGSGTLVATGEVNVSIPGTYTLSNNYTDAAGNVAQTVTRTVNVVDTIAPVISLNGDANITHEAGFVYFDANASWTDAVDGSGTLVATDQVNASKTGTYTLIYNFTDAAGNVAQTVTRTVNVEDTIAPVIALNGGANITHEAGFVYLDGNASWTDAVDGSGVLVATGGVNASFPAIYELAYHYTDEAGNEADTVIRKVHVINLAPYDLGFFSDFNLSVYENEPVGTWIADFDGVDGNPDSVLTYHLMGVMDANFTQYPNVTAESTDVTIEDFFDLDVDGSLTTVRPLDYEKDPIFFEILVRVTDQHGAYYEKPFVVSVLNDVEDLDEDGVEDHYDLDDDGDGQTDELEIRLGLDPRDRFDHAHAGMVFTLDVENLENDEYRLRGELLTDGKASPIEYGFILTSTDQNSTLYTVAADEDGSVGEEFAKVVGDLDRGKSYVYQAYVINELGMGVGQMKWIRKIVEAKLPEIFNEAEELDGGWYTSWMGEFWMGEERKWLYHLSLGWVFLSEDGQGGVWIWHEPDGWLWTKSGVWPFLWSQNTANWTYLIENLSIPILYDYSIRDLR